MLFGLYACVGASGSSQHSSKAREQCPTLISVPRAVVALAVIDEVTNPQSWRAARVRATMRS